jgi:2-aminobenzoate-CoA ligase
MIHIFISHAPEHVKRGATGQAISGYSAAVLDESGERCAPGQIGRLAVKGPTGCRYLADERQKNYVIQEGKMRGWNVTGDAYVMDMDGYFIYQARTDDMIISAGYNIAGPEVEGALLSHPAVAECGVVGRPDAGRGMIVFAFVVLKKDFSSDDAMKKELQEHVKRNIAPYKYPREIEFVAALPRTETGKLQRFKLRTTS